MQHIDLPLVDYIGLRGWLDGLEAVAHGFKCVLLIIPQHWRVATLKYKDNYEKYFVHFPLLSTTYLL